MGTCCLGFRLLIRRVKRFSVNRFTFLLNVLIIRSAARPLHVGKKLARPSLCSNPYLNSLELEIPHEPLIGMAFLMSSPPFAAAGIQERYLDRAFGLPPPS